MDDVAPEAVCLTSCGEQCTIIIVLFGRQNEGNIIFSVSGREIQRVLSRISNDVGASLAEISIFGSLFHYESGKAPIKN